MRAHRPEASFSRFSSSSPVAILITFTALPITSAGRFSPRGPLGIGLLLLGALDAQSLADNFPLGISLDASALLVGLCEAPLGLGDYLARCVPLVAHC